MAQVPWSSGQYLQQHVYWVCESRITFFMWNSCITHNAHNWTFLLRCPNDFNSARWLHPDLMSYYIYDTHITFSNAAPSKISIWLLWLLLLLPRNVASSIYSCLMKDVHAWCPAWRLVKLYMVNERTLCIWHFTLQLCNLWLYVMAYCVLQCYKYRKWQSQRSAQLVDWWIRRSSSSCPALQSKTEHLFADVVFM